MAFEELLQLLARTEAVEAKQAEVMRLSMLATAEGLASGELTPADPELKQLAARLEAHALAEIGKASGSVEEFTRMAAEFAGKPGGEAVAEAHRRLAASAAALGARATEYVTFMRGVGALPRMPPLPLPLRKPRRRPPRRGAGSPTPDTWARSGATEEMLMDREPNRM